MDLIPVGTITDAYQITWSDAAQATAYGEPGSPASCPSPTPVAVPADILRAVRSVIHDARLGKGIDAFLRRPTVLYFGRWLTEAGEETGSYVRSDDPGLDIEAISEILWQGHKAAIGAESSAAAAGVPPTFIAIYRIDLAAGEIHAVQNGRAS